MPLGICNFILKSAERRATTHLPPSPCRSAGKRRRGHVPSPAGTLPRGRELHRLSEQLFSFAVLLDSSESPAGVYSHCQDRDLKTFFNRRLSLVFSSVLTMAKMQAQEWRQTGKALTLQTRTQIKRCSVHTRNYSTPLNRKSLLKRIILALGHFSHCH